MRHVYQERMPGPRTGMKMSLDLGVFPETMMLPREGLVIFDLKDLQGNQLAYWEKKNILTKDAGILAARLFANAQLPVPNRNNGLYMLAVGTGATGNLLSPDAPTQTQRKLNNEIQRKPFVSYQFRNDSGVAVSIPTHIVDFTTTFVENEAVGALNEMGLISSYSTNPAVTNPINNGPSNYDPTIDTTLLDLMANYLTFGVVTKPAMAILTLTWRLTW